MDLAEGLDANLKRFEKQIIEECLKEMPDVDKAAQKLKISRSSLYKKLKEHQIEWSKLMSEISLWNDPRFVRLALHVMAFIVIVGLPLFIMQRSNQKWIGAWASVKSWFIAAPILFVGRSSSWKVAIRSCCDVCHLRF